MPNATCSQQNRCRKHRKCKECAIIRMYRLTKEISANIPRGKKITYTVIRPESPEQTPEIRRKLSKWLSKRTDGHIWSIETGTTTYGLHINIITNAESAVSHAEITEQVHTAASIWSAQIKYCDIGIIARYINKPKGIPSKTEYDGRLSGKSGNMRPLISYLKTSTVGIASLAAQNIMLEKAGFPKEKTHNPDPMLNALPAIGKFVSMPHSYEKYAVDRWGNIVDNPNYTPPIEGEKPNTGQSP